ncbi:MAG: thrombospondin type 3 repeat-containing protein [Phycisphaerales bacterium]
MTPRTTTSDARRATSTRHRAGDARLALAGAVSALATAAASADVTVSLGQLQAPGMHFLRIAAPGELVGTLTGVTVSAVISVSVSKTYAQDLTVYVDALPLDGAGQLQVGGFTPLAETATHLMWPSGDDFRWGTPVSGTVALPAPLALGGTPLAVFVGNGYGTPWASGTWTGSVTLHGVTRAIDLDTDGDGIPNAGDNCPSVPNPDQADCDQDAVGDACDPGADINANGVPDNCECLGDVSLDGNVDGIDLGLLLAAWGAVTPSGASQRSDIARDGNVDGVDLGQLLSRWGVCGN